MPITQSRMVATLSAALDYRNAFQEAIATIKRTAWLVESGQQSHESFYNDILLLITDSLVKDKYNSDLTIGLESYHFSPSRQKANERAAQKAYRKRRSEGATPQNTAQNRAGFTPVIEQPPKTIYPEETHCIVCTRHRSTQYCGLPVRDVADYCPHQKPPDPTDAPQSIEPPI